MPKSGKYTFIHKYTTYKYYRSYIQVLLETSLTVASSHEYTATFVSHLLFCSILILTLHRIIQSNVWVEFP